MSCHTESKRLVKLYSLVGHGGTGLLSSTCKVEAKGSGVQGHPPLCIELEANLSYMRPCFKDKIIKNILHY